MKGIPEVIRDADPLGYEPPRSQTDRALRRQAVLDAPFQPPRAVARRTALTAIVAASAATVAAGSWYWSRAAVDVIAAVRFEVRLAETSPGPGLREAAVGGTDRKIYLHEDVVAVNSDIAQARVVPGTRPGTFSAALTFTPAGSAKMARASGGHIGRPMAILIDGRVVMAPTVRAVMSTEAIINGDFSQSEIQRIVDGIVGR